MDFKYKNITANNLADFQKTYVKTMFLLDRTKVHLTQMVAAHKAIIENQ